MEHHRLPEARQCFQMAAQGRVEALIRDLEHNLPPE